MKVLSKLRRYGLATISCGIALVVAWPIDAPASCFLLAVTVSGLFGGLGPGLLSVGLSALAFGYFFLGRTLPPAVEPAVYLRFAVFLVATLLITGLMEIKRRVEQSRNRAEEALRQAQTDLARISRITTMGELTASRAHEVNQPIAAAITDANTCLRGSTVITPMWKRRARPRRELSKTRPVRRQSSAEPACSSRRAVRAGVGLPAGQADQIFNPFFTTKPHGTGMGLRISRSIIESHGGRLWPSDNSPRGTSALPIEAKARQ
jgi:signal transduction histidine kinase